MQKALTSGLSGLRANQQYLDVIGTNLANVNTAGYKSSRVTFVEMFGQSVRPGSGPTNGMGGVNPSQVGTGTRLGSIDVNMVQGSLLNTGRNLDVAIQGEGFFVVKDSRGSYYSRVGSFGLDSQNTMVDLRTGYRVQSSQGNDIAIDLNAVLPGEATQDLVVAGNLPSERTGPTSELFQTDRPFVEADPAMVTGLDLAAGGGTVDLTGNSELRIRIGSSAITTIPLTTGISAVPIQAAASAAQIVAKLNVEFQEKNMEAVAVANGDSVEITSTVQGDRSEIFIDSRPVGANGNAASLLFAAADIGTTLSGAERPATAATELNSLLSNGTDYVEGQTIEFTGMAPDGQALSGIFTYGTTNGTTLGDLVTYINGVFQNQTNAATLSIDTEGNVELVADDPGQARLSLSITDGGAVSNTNWQTQIFKRVTKGEDPDQYTLTTEVYDFTGTRRPVTLTFTRGLEQDWTLEASVDSTVGRVITAPIPGIEFDQSGLLNKLPDTTFQFEWAGVPGVQDVRMDLGIVGDAEGVTQFGIGASLEGNPDGFAAGTLQNIDIRSDGVVQGFFTNGQIRDLDRLGIALFTNPEGLEQLGDTLWGVSSNSGAPQFTAAQDSSAGNIVSGTLEGSNVDVAQEFVRLIEAQRAFQANARVISTSDEVLQELVRLI